VLEVRGGPREETGRPPRDRVLAIRDAAAEFTDDWLLRHEAEALLEESQAAAQP
jgi:hypothetical protein